MQLSLFNKEDLGFMPTQKRLGYGIQYYGSKEILCPDLFAKIKELMPHATHFYDLFGGGGSVSWHAVASNLTTHYNELGYRLFKMYEYVFDCVANPRNEWGIFDKECYMWHDQHFIMDICQKHTGNKDAYKYILGYIWSFNCSGAGYAYGYKQAEAIKKARIRRLGFEMVMYPYVKPKQSLKKIIDEMCEYLFSDSKCKSKTFYKERTKALFAEFCEGKPYVNWHWIKRRKFYSFAIMLESLRVSDLWEYYAEYGENDIFKDLETFAKYPKFKMCETISRLRPDLVASAKQFKTSKGKPRGIERGELTGLQNLEKLQRLERLQRLESLENLQRLERLENLQNLENLQSLESLQNLEKLQRIESLERLERLERLENLQNLENLQRIERIERLENLQRLERISQLKCDLHKITISNKSYADFDFAKIAKEKGLKPNEIIIYCFDKETEIFTQNGWKYLKDIDLDCDLFLSRNPKNNEIDFVKGILKQNFHYKGKMYNYKGKSIDLCVTPNHRLLIAKRNTKKNTFSNHFILAEDFYNEKNTNSYFISAGGIWNGKHIETIDICNKSYNLKDFAFLLGIFITDGSVNKQGSITISQSKKQNVAIIKDLLDRLDIKYTYSAKNNYFYIARELLPFFKQFYLKEQRRIPADFKSLSKDILQNLLNGIILGDGCVATNKTEICICDNKGLINDICEIIYKCGLACRITTINPQKAYLKSENRYINAKKPYTKIRIHTTKYKLRYSINEYLCNYDDFVYCVTLEKWNSVLVRRNNKQIWCGQCDIPYQDSKSQSTYNGIYADGFDIREFYKWSVTQAKNGFNVFLSEYNPPENFLESVDIDKDFAFVDVMSKAKRTYSQWNGDNNIENSRTALEKLFVMFGKKS